MQFEKIYFVTNHSIHSKLGSKYCATFKGTHFSCKKMCRIVFPHLITIETKICMFFIWHFDHILGVNRRQKLDRISECKNATRFEKVLKGYPVEFCTFLYYTRQLRFDELPDYMYLRYSAQNFLKCKKWKRENKKNNKKNKNKNEKKPKIKR